MSEILQLRQFFSSCTHNASHQWRFAERSAARRPKAPNCMRLLGFILSVPIPCYIATIHRKPHGVYPDSPYSHRFHHHRPRDCHQDLSDNSMSPHHRPHDCHQDLSNSLTISRRIELIFHSRMLCKTMTLRHKPQWLRLLKSRKL